MYNEPQASPQTALRLGSAGANKSAEPHCIPEVLIAIMEVHLYLANRSEDGVVGPQRHVQPVASSICPAAAHNVQRMGHGHVLHLDTRTLEDVSSAVRRPSAATETASCCRNAARNDILRSVHSGKGVTFSLMAFQDKSQ